MSAHEEQQNVSSEMHFAERIDGASSEFSPNLIGENPNKSGTPPSPDFYTHTDDEQMDPGKFG